jgi:uncharacterized protein (TIGR03435 family)
LRKTITAYFYRRNGAARRKFFKKIVRFVRNRAFIGEMQVMDDMTLLREYAAGNSEPAFAELVSRRAGFVYSAALRQVRDPHLAEEITQAVFIVLAQKAGRISDKTNLTGWLFKTTRFAALAQIRATAKRQRREQEAFMQSELQPTAPDALWEQMSPLLDEALAKLGDKDRQAVLLRFCENKSLAEVGDSLGAGEDTARKRVSRALEKLRKFFSKRGVVSTTTIIAGAIAANSVQAAPAALAKSVTAVAVVKGSTAAVSTLTLVKGMLKLMTLAKLKTAALLGATIILATGTTVVVSKAVAQSSDGSSAIDDSAWAQIDTRSLNALPPVFILRPTHFASAGGGIGGGGGMAKAGNQMLGRDIPFDMLMGLAYDVDMIRVVSSADKPAGGYDLLITTPDASKEQLQKEIRQKFGYIAHHETRQTDVLLLTLKQTGAPGLKPSQAQLGGRGFSSSSSRSSSSAGGGTRSKTTASQNQSIANFIKNLQGYFDKPIIDQTGLTGNFDVSLNVTTGNGSSESDAIMQALPAQLGLELSPSHEPIEILVVEKVK